MYHPVLKHAHVDFNNPPDETGFQCAYSNYNKITLQADTADLRVEVRVYPYFICLNLPTPGFKTIP